MYGQYEDEHIRHNSEDAGEVGAAEYRIAQRLLEQEHHFMFQVPLEALTPEEQGLVKAEDADGSKRRITGEGDRNELDH